MSNEFSELRLFESYNDRHDIAWSPSFMEMVNSQRLTRDEAAEAVELSRVVPDDLLDDEDWHLIHEITQAQETAQAAAVELAYRRIEHEVNEALTGNGGALELSNAVMEDIDMGYIKDFGKYDQSGPKTEYETADRATRDFATYGYDPGAYETKDDRAPVIDRGNADRARTIDETYASNPWMAPGHANGGRHEALREADGRAKRTVEARGYQDKNGNPTYADGSPVYGINGPVTSSSIEADAFNTVVRREDQRIVDSLTPREAAEMFRQQTNMGH